MTAHVHVWTICQCGAVRDDERPRRGRSARRMGGDQERRLERAYGPSKVGELGGPVDLLGEDFAWQSKSTRGRMPAWAEAIDEPVVRSAPAWVIRAADAMESDRGGRAPLVVRTFVRRGVPARDLIWVRAIDWWRIHGGDEPDRAAWLVMGGAAFLAIHGRDGEEGR